jgi:O-antigen ligase
MSAVGTPLLDAFRARREETRRAHNRAAGNWTRTLVFGLTALLPVAVCIYLATLDPVATIRSIEFTQPDIIVICLLIVVVARGFFKGFHGLSGDIARPLAFFFIASCLSAMAAGDKLRAYAAIIQMGEFVALAWGVSLITSAKAALRIVQFILCLFVFQSVIAIAQFAASDPFPRGTFFTNQKYSMFMGAGAAMSFALFVAEKRGWKRVLYFACMLTILSGAILGEERAPWLAFLISASAIVWFTGKQRKRWALGLLATVCLAVAVVASVPDLRDRTISRLGEVQIEGEKKNTLLSRLAVWGVALNLFREHPLLGVGPKNFVSLVPSLLTSDEMGGLDAAESHNVWIGILAEGGIIGFLTYLYLCYSILGLVTPHLGTIQSGETRNLYFAFASYNFFWLAMSYHYFTKGEGHIHFLMLGLVLGVQKGLSHNMPMLPFAPVQETL